MISSVNNVCVGLNCSENIKNKKESGKFSSLLTCSSFEIKLSHIQDSPTAVKFGIY